jgi:hypothetical protein
MYKIIGADQKEYGPIPGETIRQWMQEGRLNASSKIQAEGTSQWKLLREMPEFASILPPPPAPITLPAGPRVPPNNAMAGWALGTGIFAVLCCQICGPVSIVLGFIALSQIKENPNRGGRGLAVGGIVLGCISILMSIVGFILITMTGGLANALNGFPH